MRNFRIQLGSMVALLALLAGVVSLPLSSEVSFGPTVGAFACLLAIIARIIQAGGQHQDRERWREEDRKATTA